jgi:tetratricopeptide (TPR) repeat protein
MKRRDLLGLWNAASAALVWPVLPSVDWARMDNALADRSGVDERVLDDLAALDRNLWQAFWPALRPQLLLDEALGQFRRVSRLLPAARTPAHHRQLCALLARASHLLGVIYLDSDRDDAAVTALTFAATAAKEAEDYDLWAGALVRHAWVPIYDDRPDQALPLLHAAARLAQRGSNSLPTRFWVAAVAADAYAGVGDAPASARALGHAERVHDLGSQRDDAWLRFNPVQLLEERGGTYVTARRPDLAEPALRRALVHWPEPGRRRGLIMADLAGALVQLREVEQACVFGQELVNLTRQCSGMFLKALRDLDAALDAFEQVPAVKALRAQIPLVT